jgi:hypothetical protein
MVFLINIMARVDVCKFFLTSRAAKIYTIDNNYSSTVVVKTKKIKKFSNLKKCASLFSVRGHLVNAFHAL